jgi:hypothetical protein
MASAAAAPSIVIEDRFARISWHKPPTLKAFSNALLAIKSNPRFERDKGLLIVDHGTGFSLRDVDDARRWIGRTAEHLRWFRAIAYTVSRDAQFETAAMLSVTALEVGINLRAFKDEVQAGRWLLRT